MFKYEKVKGLEKRRRIWEIVRSNDKYGIL